MMIHRFLRMHLSRRGLDDPQSEARALTAPREARPVNIGPAFRVARKLHSGRKATARMFPSGKDQPDQLHSRSDREVRVTIGRASKRINGKLANGRQINRKLSPSVMSFTESARRCKE